MNELESITPDTSHTLAPETKTTSTASEKMPFVVESGADTGISFSKPYVRIPYISYLRAIACFAIVILHTMNVAVILYKDQITADQNMLSMMMVYGCMWAVPCFIMVTGALQMNPETEVSLKELITLFTWRIVKALLLCCVFFQLFDIFMDKAPFTPANIFKAFTELFTGQSWAHIWYLYMLIGLYLLMPFFRLITKHGSNRLIRYGLLVTIFFISILPLTSLKGMESAFVIPLTSIYPVYLFLGYAIHNNILKINKTIGAVAAVIGLAALLLLTFCKSRYFEAMPDYLLGSYAAFPVVISSAGVFAVFKDTSIRNVFGKILYEIDRCSFGIYLFHMIFVRLILRYWQVNPYEYGPWAFALLIVVIFAVSYVLVFILKKIPVIKNII